LRAYPERHPESGSWEAELDNLKRKVDAGATQAITQFFVQPDVFLRFIDRVQDAGITLPIIPGIMKALSGSIFIRSTKMIWPTLWPVC